MALSETERARLEEQLRKLRDARARGLRRVRDQSSTGAMSEMEYQPDKDIAAAIQDLERRLATGSRPPIRTVRIATHKGY